MAKKAPGAPPQYGGGGDVPQGATMNTPMVSQNAPPTSGPGMAMGNPQGGMFQQAPAAFDPVAVAAPAAQQMAAQGPQKGGATPPQYGGGAPGGGQFSNIANQAVQQGTGRKGGQAPPQYQGLPPSFSPQGQGAQMANMMRQNPNCP